MVVVKKLPIVKDNVYEKIIITIKPKPYEYEILDKVYNELKLLKR